MKGREPYKIRPKEKEKKKKIYQKRKPVGWLAPSRATRNFLGNKPQRRHGMLQKKERKRNKTKQMRSNGPPKNQSNFKKIKIKSISPLLW
jgi:hypothetical protein